MDIEAIADPIKRERRFTPFSQYPDYCEAKHMTSSWLFNFGRFR